MNELEILKRALCETIKRSKNNQRLIEIATRFGIKTHLISEQIEYVRDIEFLTAQINKEKDRIEMKHAKVSIENNASD